MEAQTKGTGTERQTIVTFSPNFAFHFQTSHNNAEFRVFWMHFNRFEYVHTAPRPAVHGCASCAPHQVQKAQQASACHPIGRSQSLPPEGNGVPSMSSNRSNKSSASDHPWPPANYPITQLELPWASTVWPWSSVQHPQLRSKVVCFTWLSFVDWRYQVDWISLLKPTRIWT